MLLRRANRTIHKASLGSLARFFEVSELVSLAACRHFDREKMSQSLAIELYSVIVAQLYYVISLIESDPLHAYNSI